MVETQSGYQRINGIRLFVHRFREPKILPSGLTLLLVHGYLDAGATWDLVAERLTQAGHEVIAPDLRGFGQSDGVGPGGYYHFADYVADVDELVNTLAPRRLGVIGHSMGGTIAALYAGARPERVERLALLEGLGPSSTEPSFAVDRMRQWLKDLSVAERAPRAISSHQEAVERLVYRHPHVARDVLASRARFLTKLDDKGKLLWAYDPLHRTTSPMPFQAEAFKEFLKRAAMPALVVSGGDKGWHPPDEAERAACLPNAKTIEIEGAGHMMHWTKPDELGKALLSFFGKPPPMPIPSPSVPSSTPSSSAR